MSGHKCQGLTLCNISDKKDRFHSKKMKLMLRVTS